MSTPIFCCSSIRPYRPQYLSHENKFTSFVAWASFPTKSCIAGVTDLRSISVPFAMQLVRQVNFGPLESKRYFVPHEGTENVFDELGEDDLVQANFQKVNTYVFVGQFFFPIANDRLLGTRTTSAKYTISSLSLMCIRRTRSMSTTGERTWQDQRERLIYNRGSCSTKHNLL